MTKFAKEQCGICAECVPQINGGSGFTNCADAHAAETAGDKMQFTKEQLIERVKDHKATSELFAEDAVKSTTAKMDVRIYEIALAALTAGMEQEPIYQLRDVDWYDTDKQTYDTVVNAGGAGRIVYAAPQLPQPAVVPDERPSLNNGIVGFDEGWNACRAAMLKGGSDVE